MAKKKKKIRKIHAGLLAITGIIALSLCGLENIQSPRKPK